ncbi:MAG: RDD family protein [Alphaproteobacteria bacterium]
MARTRPVTPQNDPIRMSTGTAAQIDENFSREELDGVLFLRTIAFVIDWVIIAILAGIFGLVGTVLGIITLGAMLPPVYMALSILPFAYHTLTIGSPNSATFGQKAMGLEVRTWDKRRPGYVQAALQTMLFYMSVGLTSGLILILGLFNDKGRMLHDILAGTVTIKRGR